MLTIRTKGSRYIELLFLLRNIRSLDYLVDILDSDILTCVVVCIFFIAAFKAFKCRLIRTVIRMDITTL